MKKQKYELVQKVKSHYVDGDCVQIMIPHYLNSGISILNADGMTYHHQIGSNHFVNKYISDYRKNYFPYSNIPMHIKRVNGKKIECINQLLDYNKVYIEIADDIIVERFAIKKGNEALVATKYIIPKEETPKYMTRDEIMELFKTANGGIFTSSGACWQEINIPTEERILEWYKEKMIKQRKIEEEAYKYYCNHTGCDYINKEVSDFFYKKIAAMTIDDVPRDLNIFDDAILVTIENNEIKSIKSIVVKFEGKDNYKVEFYDFPITIYSLEHMLKLEQTSYVETKEPKISKRLNKTIPEEEITKAKKLVLQKNKN